MDRLKFEAIKKVYDIHFHIVEKYVYEVFGYISASKIQYEMTSMLIDMRNSRKLIIENFFIYNLRLDMDKMDVLFYIDIDFIQGTRETILLSLQESLHYGKL